MNIRIRQVYYSIFHKPFLQKGFVPYRNPSPSRYMENRILADLYHSGDHLGTDYYGIVSWRFEEKTGKTFRMIRKAVESEAAGADVYAFRCQDIGFVLEGQYIWRVAYPRTMVSIAQALFEKLGHRRDVRTLRAPIIYCNFWAARPAVLERYLTEMLLPAMSLLDEDESLRALCEQDSDYKVYPVRPGFRRLFYSKKPLSERRCREIFGKPYYTYHPFVCERLFSSWLALNPGVSVRLL